MQIVVENIEIREVNPEKMTIITITITEDEDCDLMMLFFHGCSQRYASNHECVIYVSINVL